LLIFSPNKNNSQVIAARDLVASVLASGRTMMTEPEGKKLLALCVIKRRRMSDKKLIYFSVSGRYGVTVGKTETCGPTPAEAAAMYTSEFAGQPVVLKIISPDISHKSDAGGVALNLASADAVAAAAATMLERVHQYDAKARLTGFSVQTQVMKPRGVELIVGTSTDRVFGPVVLFGQGGVATEVIKDTNLGLVPLNMTLAKRVRYEGNSTWCDTRN
jgi:acetyltransferase